MQHAQSLARRAAFAFVVMTRASAVRGDDQAPVPTPAAPSSYARASFGALPSDVPISVVETQILVDGVTVNGQGPFRFLLDTGAMGGGRVDASLATRLGLKPVGEAQGTDGSGRGGQAMPIYRLDSLALGPLTFYDVEVLSRDYNAQGAAVRGHIDGVLGFQLFRELLLTIDYAGRKLVLAQGALPEPDGQSVLAMTDDTVPTITVELAGKQQQARIDTGAMGGISVGVALAESLKLLGEPQRVGEARTVSGAFPISVAQLDGAMRIGRHTLEQPELTLGAPFREINLGGRILESFTLTFDQGHDRVEFIRGAGASGAVRIPGKPIAETKLDMQMNRPVVAVRINGKGPFPMILDTGASVTVLNADLVDELNLTSTGTTRIGDPTEPEAVEAKTHTIERMQLGDAEATRVEAVSWPDDTVSGALGDVRGVLGPSAFAGYLVTMDFPKSRVVLSQGNLSDQDGSVAWSGDDPIPTLELVLGEERIPAHLDTGNNGDFTLPTRLQEKAKVQGTPVVARARTASGDFEITIAQLDGTIRFGGQEVRNPEVRFTDRFAHGNIGSGALTAFAVTIDSANRRVLLQAGAEQTAAAPASKPPKRYGVMLAMPSEGAMVVQGTVPQSIAERAGLKTGDRIVRLNGQEAAGLDAAARGAAMRTSPLTLVIERDGKQVEIRMSHEDDPSTKTADEAPADPQGASMSAPASESAAHVAELTRRMNGRFKVQGRIWRSAGKEPELLNGRSTWQSAHGRFVHEAFELNVPEGILAGEVFFGPVSAGGELELVQIDGFNRGMIHVQGGWDASTQTVVMESPAGSPRGLRWVYRLGAGESFIKEMHTRAADGGWRLASDYRYEREQG